MSLFLAAAVVSVFFACLYIHSSREIERISEDLVLNGNSDQAKVLALLDYCSKIDTLSVKTCSEEALQHLGLEARLFAYWYRILPVNLITPMSVIDYRLSYSGACGAKSRLLVAMLESAGYEARMQGLHANDKTPLHIIAEVKLKNGWVPLDPSYNLCMERPDGTLASTEEVARCPALFARNISRWQKSHGKVYPEEYVYTNVSNTTVFYLALSVLRITHLAGLEDAPEIHERLEATFPGRLIEYDFGSPAVWQNPLLLGLSITVVLWLLSGMALLRDVLRKVKEDKRQEGRNF